MPVVAAVMPAPFAPIELREFPEPELEPGGMLLETMFSEVCGTDVHLWHGRLSGVPYPIIPGHVSVGRLAKARGPITLADGRQAREGDRIVFFDVHRTCGRCYACAVSGTPTKCVQRKVYGITDAAADGLFGGWSEAIYLEPGVVAAVLPDSVTPEDYIGGGCGLITAVHAIDRAAIRLADRVHGAGHRRRGTEHHRAGAPVGRVRRHRHRGAGRPPRPGPADGRRPDARRLPRPPPRSVTR